MDLNNEVKFDGLKLLKTLRITKILFKYFKKDYFSISETLKILKLKKIPQEIPIKNNKIFIKDISKYCVENDIPIYESEIKKITEKSDF